MSSANAEEIPDSYIIKFKSHVTDKHAANHHAWVQDLHQSTESRKLELRKRSQSPLVGDVFDGLKHTYNIAGSLLGYSGHFSEDVIEEIRSHPDVRSVSFRYPSHASRHRHGNTPSPRLRHGTSLPPLLTSIPHRSN